MRRMGALLRMAVLAVAAGCHSLEKPGLSLAAARFAEPPVIIQRGDHFYLRYRRALLEDGHYPMLSVLYAKKGDDAGYYFFSVPISHPEWGCRVERPLAYDGFEDFAPRGKVYWLDLDGTKHQLQVRPDG